ncbi:MAG TPA: hypothetical protein VL866_24135 [Pyrinomonadaceae bacterium]|nr:hypothetical protein [Pyrinomonadaceae bacterium]
MNCEYCGRFVRDETCAGCGAPNRYVHQGDPIRLRAGVDPRERGYFSTSGYFGEHTMISTAMFSTTSLGREFRRTDEF